MSSRDGIVNLCRGPETASVRKKGIDAAVGDNGRCGVGGWKLRYALPILVRPRRSADFRTEEVHFFDNELLHTFDRVLFLKEEIEFLRVDGNPLVLARR
jgi:hypothetical protein